MGLSALPKTERSGRKVLVLLPTKKLLFSQSGVTRVFAASEAQLEADGALCGTAEMC